MAAFPYMQTDVAEYLAETPHLSAEEHGAYQLLRMNYWQRGKPLRDDDVRLAIVARLPSERWAIVRKTLEEFFEIKNGEWIHHGIEAQLMRIKEKSEKARHSANAGVSKRREKISERSANAEQTLSDRAANRIEQKSVNRKRSVKQQRAHKEKTQDIHSTYSQSEENQVLGDQNSIPERYWKRNSIFNPSNSRYAWMFTDDQALRVFKELDKLRIQLPREKKEIVDEIAFAVFLGYFMKTRLKPGLDKHTKQPADGVEKAANCALKLIKAGKWTVPKGFYNFDAEHAFNSMITEGYFT